MLSKSNNVHFSKYAMNIQKTTGTSDMDACSTQVGGSWILIATMMMMVHDDDGG